MINLPKTVRAVVWQRATSFSESETIHTLHPLATSDVSRLSLRYLYNAGQQTSDGC